MFIKMGVKKLITSKQELRKVASHIHEKYPQYSTGTIKRRCAASTFLFGTDYSEYEALNFINREWKNKKTYLTVFRWLSYINIYNPLEYRYIFHDKIVFNRTFEKYLNREWIAIDDVSKDELISFFRRHNDVVLKESHGNCGNSVLVIRSSDYTDIELLDLIKGRFNLAEQKLENIECIRKMNASSLNTMRIVSIHSPDVFNVLFACQRIGPEGGSVDNISRGGSSARINIKTGMFETAFFGNAYRAVAGTKTGYIDSSVNKIPFWEETLAMLREASKLVPQIHIVGWDVAITPNGPAIIEANEMCDTAIMQYYNGLKEDGLLSSFYSMIESINNSSIKPSCENY